MDEIKEGHAYAWPSLKNFLSVTLRIEDKNNMWTFGCHRRFRFAEDWEVVWSSYEDGLDCHDWIEANEHWLKNISIDKEVQEEIFRAFQASDWRHGSCGGCI